MEEGFEGEGDGVERVEDEVAGGDAERVEGLFRRRGMNFVLSVEGKMQRRGRRRDGARNGVFELQQRTGIRDFDFKGFFGFQRSESQLHRL